MTLEELVNSDRQSDRKRAAVDQNLTSEQFKKLFHDKKTSVRIEIIKQIDAVELNKQQISKMLFTEDIGIITQLKKRKDFYESILNLIFADKKLKYLYIKRRW